MISIIIVIKEDFQFNFIRTRRGSVGLPCQSDGEKIFDVKTLLWGANEDWRPVKHFIWQRVHPDNFAQGGTFARGYLLRIPSLNVDLSAVNPNAFRRSKMKNHQTDMILKPSENFYLKC